MGGVFEVMPYFDEADLLAARLELMAGHDVVHAICEGDRTFQGTPKPFSAPWPLGQVISLRGELPPIATPFEREAFQRDLGVEFCRGVAAGDPDALIISCDVDEFIDPAALDDLRTATRQYPHVAVGMRNIVFGEWENDRPLFHARAFRARNTPPSLHQLAAAPLYGIPDCGWHLTWLGDVARRRRKAEAFSHTECRPGNPIWKWIAQGRPDPTGEPHHLADLTSLPEVLRRLIADTGGPT